MVQSRQSTATAKGRIDENPTMTLIANVDNIAPVTRRTRPTRNASSAPPILDTNATVAVKVASSVAPSSNSAPVPRQNTRHPTIQKRMAKSSVPWPA